MNKTLVTLAAVATGVLAVASPASAERPAPLVGNPNASCVGIALSEHAVNDGPGFVAAEAAQVKAIADAFGFANAGQVVSRFASVRAGTHAGCEAAIFQIIVGNWISGVIARCVRIHHGAREVG